MPLIFTLDELRRSADVFAIELLDMKIITGCSTARFSGKSECSVGFAPAAGGTRTANELAAFAPSDSCGTAQEKDSVENHARFRGAVLRTVSPRADGAGQPAPATKREAVQAIAKAAGADASGFQSILDFREGKRKEKDIDIEPTLQTYLEFVEVVTNEVLLGGSKLPRGFERISIRRQGGCS